MAKQTGPVKIRGTIDDIVFYEQEGEYYARYNGTVSRQRILKSDAYALFRKYGQEFRYCQQAFTLLKNSLRGVLCLNYRFAYLRFLQLMLEIRTFDRCSALGERTIAKAIQNQEAKELLGGFDFNMDRSFSQTLSKPIGITGCKAIGINELTPERDLVFPPRASCALIKAARLHIDLNTGETRTVPYECLRIHKKDKAADLLLKPLLDLESKGAVFYFLQIEFYRIKKDGKAKGVGEGKQNALCIIAIDPELPFAFRPKAAVPLEKTWQRRNRSTSTRIIDCETGQIFRGDDLL